METNYANTLANDLVKKFNSITGLQNIETIGSLYKSVRNSMFSTIITDNTNLMKCDGSSFGAATGVVLYQSHVAEVNLCQQDYILVCDNDSLETVKYFKNVRGIILLDLSSSAHLAIIARSRAIPTIIVNDINIKKVVYNSCIKGEICSIDGTRGYFCTGKSSINEVNPYIITRLTKWCKYVESSNYEPLPVIFGSGDTPMEIKRAFKNGAKGIGGCRIEHMFLNQRDIMIARRILFTDYCEKSDLDAMEAVIFENLIESLSVVGDQMFVVRLMDALSSEFLPSSNLEKRLLMQQLNLSEDRYHELESHIKTSDGMAGIRGARLGLIKSEIYQKQIEAILKAVKYSMDRGTDVNLAICIPFIRSVDELKIIKNMIDASKQSLGYKKINIKIACMIEIPSAAFQASKLAQLCDIFVIGSNDLTQFVHAVSRNGMDENYFSKLGVCDLFKRFDKEIVGRIVSKAIIDGRKTNKNLLIGICGEHGADVSSYEYFKEIGINFVSSVSNKVLLIRVVSCLLALKKYISED